MSLADLTPEAVRQAIAEFDRLGRDTFLSAYGFGKARGYFLVHNGQTYDSKAIAGVAHQYLPGQVLLTSDAFSGGEDAAAGRLRELGFDIRRPDEQLMGTPTSEPGGIYNRVRDIHDVYGGQRNLQIDLRLEMITGVPWLGVHCGEALSCFRLET
jgi:hypothetical protein